MRPIDADALEEAITTDYWEHFTQCHDTGQIALIDMVREDIGNAPTVDAVEVVRCKDCKSYVNRECKNLVRHMTNPCSIYTLPYDFCSYGERKDNENP